MRGWTGPRDSPALLSDRRPGVFRVAAIGEADLYTRWTTHGSETEAIAFAKRLWVVDPKSQVVVLDHNNLPVWPAEGRRPSKTFRRRDREDGAVDLHPLLKRAHEIAADRSGQYGDWQSTARTYCPDDLSEYPKAMVRAKLARDPDLRQADTLVDLVNYLGMIFELGERDKVKP